MTIVATNRSVVETTLVRSVAAAPCYPGMARIGHKLARGIADFLSALMSAPANVSAGEVRIEEPAADDNLIISQVTLDPLGGRMEFALPRATLMSLVDVYYGGDGAEDQVRKQLSPAETRFLARIAEALCTLLAAAWLPYGQISPRLDEDAVPQAGEAVVQTFAVSLADRAAFAIHCRYPLAALEAFPELQSAAPAQGEQALADHDWQARLMGRALDVTFPVRAVFAEPEVPLERLMSLRPGDVIPVCLPTTIELSVAGLPFARGSAGESNGRAAICIDQI